jgi:RNA polymerase sigma factor (sigma-70 family)
MSGESGHRLVPYLPLLDKLIGHEGRRRRLRGDEIEDLGSYVRLRLLERGGEVLDKFQGGSSIETYLAVVVKRIYLDWRRQKWGDWRPSTLAQRLGDVAVELERLWVREALAWDHVQATLHSRFGQEAAPAALEALRDQLGSQRRPKLAGEEALESLRDPSASADAALLERERKEAADRLARTVEESIAGLEPEDRLVLRLHFKEQKSLRTIAEVLGCDHRRIHRQVGRVLWDLRQQLSERGCTRDMVILALECQEMTLATIAWDTGGGPPSMKEGADG